MRRASWLWPVIILLSAAACAVLTFAATSGPPRAVAALWFLGICPGMAWVRTIQIRDPLMELTLAIALSITLDTIVASVLVYGNAWSPNLGLVVLLVLTVAGALVALPHRRTEEATA